MSARRKDNGHVRQARSLANGCADRLADFRHHHAPASVHGRVDDLDAWDRDRSLGHVRQSLFARSRVEELPGANTQGATLEEARSNLQEAVELVLEANRVLAEEALDGRAVIREPFVLLSK